MMEAGAATAEPAAPGSASAKLRVALLGAPLVERAGVPVSFDTRKATALLAYLAVTGHPHSRDTLTALLWPDYDRSRGRSALRRTLSVLNAATGGDCLTIDRHAVGLHPGLVAVDVVEFQQAAADVRHGHPADRSCPRCVAALESAAALYRDDFLAGFALRDSPEYDDWQSFQAETLRRQLAGVLERLVRARVRASQPGVAVDQARRWLALDPLQERAHGVLMRLYSWSGQRGAALRQYRECVRVLDRELGVPPLSQTTALYDAIRSGRLPPPPRPTAAVAAAAATTRPADAPPPAMPMGDLPLVGRSAELDLLEQARLSVGDTGALVTILGEAGIGKTRLLTSLAATVGRAGGRVAVARCHQGEEGLAFGVLADLLRAALRVSSSPASGLPAASRVEVGRLLPELSPAGEALPTLDSPGAQSRFYAALIATLAGALGPGPLLAVEDLQWADDSSAAVLGYLLRRLSQIPMLIALTWRPDALPATSPLRAALAEVRRDGRVTALAPARLDAESVTELTRAALPPELATAATVDRLHEETGGLPLFLTEYLDAFRRAGRIPTAGEWQLPGGMRELLQARLTGLSETTGQLLAALAVLGSDAEQPTLRATSGRSEDEVVAGIEQAGRRAVLVETGHGGYEFAHDGLRRLVSETTSLARLRLLHGRAADALASRHDAYLLAPTIAAHLRRAGRDADAAEWSWQAAQRARSLYAHAEALDHLNAAVTLGYPGHLVHHVVGDVLTALGRYGDSLTAYEQAAAVCPPDDRRSLAAVEHKLADVHHRLGEWEVAASHLSAALELFDGDEDPALRARVLADLALVAHRRSDSTGAARYVQQALELAVSSRDEAALAQAYDVLGVLAAERADFAGATEHLQASLGHAAGLPDPSLRVAALNNLALVHAAAGRADDAVAVGREALQRGLEHGDRHRAAALHTNLADLLHAAGQQAEALDHLTAAARLFAGVDDAQVRRPEIWKLAQW